MKVVLLGPPGAGKGTQADRLSASMSVPKVSSGDLFRDHQKRDTELGRLARAYMEKGALVPDSVTIKMVMQWINKHQEQGGFLLDGFPRTLLQAESLGTELENTGGIDRALYINVPEKVVLDRLGGRLVCKGCGYPHHLRDAPPNPKGECVKCDGELFQRDDDKPEAVRKRIQVYLSETEPLIEYYRKSGVLVEINGESSIEEVGSKLVAALN